MDLYTVRTVTAQIIP